MNPAHQVLSNAELIATVFSFLKDDETEWKGPAAKLAVVNRSFFHASIAVVWEDMHSLQPFFQVLWPERPDEDQLFHSISLSEDELHQRFSLYASKARCLTLGVDTQLLLEAPSWAIWLAKCEKRSVCLFPGLVSLNLNSADSLSMLIASSVHSYIQSINIDIKEESYTAQQSEEQAKGAILDLISKLGSGNKALKGLRVLRPTIRDDGLFPLSKIESVQYLWVFVDLESGGALLPTVWHTPRLLICQRLTKLRDTSRISQDPRLSASFHREVQACVNRPRELSVWGTSKLHDIVAESVCEATSRGYKSIGLVAGNPGHRVPQSPLTSATLAKYLKSNPEVASFTVQVYPSQKPSPADLERIRSDSAFRSTEQFLRQVTASQNLTTLAFIGIRLPLGESISMMLEAVQGLPQLRTFLLIPVPISEDEADALVYPSMSSLRDVALRCPRVCMMAIPTDMHNMDFATPSSETGPKPSLSDMLHLAFYPSPKGIPQYSEGQRVRLDEYLVRLFPKLGGVGDAGTEKGRIVLSDGMPGPLGYVIYQAVRMRQCA